MDRKKIGKIVTIITGVAVLAAALFIMINGLGLSDSLDFGAGAYYYADIPDFDKNLTPGRFTASLPFWVYVLLFLAWGALMYAVWRWLDRRK
ncbi:MAG: hypothetical protein J5764_03185 [Bacteroidales bacterium]|nr:hypothetical protein [Bacteroidales bacterium]